MDEKSCHLTLKLIMKPLFKLLIKDNMRSYLTLLIPQSQTHVQSVVEFQNIMTEIYLDSIQEIMPTFKIEMSAPKLAQTSKNDIDLDELDFHLPWLFDPEKLIIIKQHKKSTFCNLCQSMHHFCPYSACKKSFKSLIHLDQHLQKSHGFQILTEIKPF